MGEDENKGFFQKGWVKTGKTKEEKGKVEKRENVGVKRI